MWMYGVTIVRNPLLRNSLMKSKAKRFVVFFVADDVRFSSVKSSLNFWTTERVDLANASSKTWGFLNFTIPSWLIFPFQLCREGFLIIRIEVYSRSILVNFSESIVRSTYLHLSILSDRSSFYCDYVLFLFQPLHIRKIRNIYFFSFRSTKWSTINSDKMKGKFY